MPGELWFRYRLLLRGAPCAYGTVCVLVGHVSNGTNATIVPNGGKKKKQGKKGGRERSTLSVADTDEEFILWH